MLIKPKIYIEYDGTLNDLIYSWISHINTGIPNKEEHFSLNDVNHYNWFWDREEEGVFPIFDFFKNKPYLSKRINILSGAVSFVNSLSNFFSVSVLTATHDDKLIKEKNIHIKKYFRAVNIIHETEKYKYATQEGGIERPNILIDDNPKSCLEWARAGGVAFLYTHDGNYKYAHIRESGYNGKRLILANNYSEILSHISSWTLIALKNDTMTQKNKKEEYYV